MDVSTRFSRPVDGDVAVVDAEDSPASRGAMEPSPLTKTTRSFSDGDSTPSRPKLSPSPLILEADRRTSKDDSALRNPTPAAPVTPNRPGFFQRSSALSSSLYMSQHAVTAATATAAAATASITTAATAALAAPPSAAGPIAGSQQQQQQHTRQAPLSPKLDHSHIYASPTSALPRRSRGLDFSRAATSLHHSTLAEQSSPDSSPTHVGRGAMKIPGASGAKRLGAGFGAAETSTNSLWSMMGSHERMHISSSVGSTAHMVPSDSSSSSDLDDDLMDEDAPDEPYVTTPQINRTTMVPGMSSTYSPSAPGLSAPLALGGSPAVNSLLSFQQRQRPRKQPKKKLRGPIGLGFSSFASHGGGLGACKSPPSSLGRDANQHSRRESISWAANQLNLSGNESDDSTKHMVRDGVEAVMGAPVQGGGQNEVIRRVVHRRGNMMPKTKAFARMRAALAEEHAPIDNEVRREAEVVRQVRESDMVEHARVPPQSLSVATTALSSPTMGSAQDVDDMVDDAMVVDTGAVVGALGMSSSFKQQAMKGVRGNKNFWDTFSESSSGGGGGGGGGMTPPPSASLQPRGPPSAVSGSNDDMSMDSPSAGSAPTAAMMAGGGIFPMSMTTRSSSACDTPLHQQQQQQNAGGGGGTMGAPQQMPPTAAEITRRINNKRRRDDDFDPASFKRRAVSPGLSAHNSPITQSPLQRDMSWGSRPGSNGHDRPGGSESGGSQVGSQQGGRGSGGGGGHNKGRVGYQGMVDTNDGITKLSIE